MGLKKMHIIVNGIKRMVVFEPETDMLSDVIRRIGLTGTKVGCGVGQCGACSVILNGEVVRSCARKMKNIKEYSEIETIEGMGTAENLHPLQAAFMTYGGVQCGFCSPGFIMSAKGLLAENPDPTREEVRQWFTKKRNVCRCTGYKPIIDAVMAAAKVMRGEASVADITDKTPNTNVYGSRLRRPTALSKVTGTAEYGDDMKYKLPGSPLHLAIVQPRIASHAKIVSIDIQPALAMPGVVRVVTAKDVLGLNKSVIPVNHARSTLKGFERPILADEKIFRYGDVVAVVIAETEAWARAAAKMVKVEIEPLPEYMNLLDAVAPDAVRIHEQSPNVFIKQPVFKGEEARDVIEESYCSVEGSFRAGREPHLSIEGDTMQGYWDEHGNLTIQCKCMGIGWDRAAVAAGIGMPVEKVRIIENTVGGSFGWAVSPAGFAIMGICLMLIKDRPLTLTMSYEEFMHFSGKRSPAYMNIAMACDKQGKLTAVEFDACLDHGPYTEVATDLIYKIGAFIGWPYVIPNVSGLARMAVTNHNFGTAYRGFGSTQTYVGSEAVIDMLAEKMGMDPLEFRYINVARPGDLTINSYPYRQTPMVEIYDKMRPIYKAALERAKAEDTAELRRGVGIVSGGFASTLGASDHAEVAISFDGDGCFTAYNTWEDMGQGGDIGTLTLTCEALKPLGVTADQIRLIMNDSHECPDTGVAAGSRCHFMAGNATIDAANQLMAAMRKPDGTYRTHAEMVAEGIATKYVGVYDTTGTGCELDPNTGVGDPVQTYMYGAFLAEVAVETATGKTTCLGITAVADVGTLGNALSVEGQAYGGISHGVGYALQTDYEDIKKHGTMAGAGIPYCNDIPDKIDLHFIENPRETGPFGSSGCSELFQSSAHVAILNAINNAAGVRMYQAPSKPEAIKAAIEAKARGEEQKPGKYFLGSELYDELDDIRANPV